MINRNKGRKERFLTLAWSWASFETHLEFIRYRRGGERGGDEQRIVASQGREVNPRS